MPPSPKLKAFEPDTPANYERKVASLEKETMRLQEALRDRDEEIQALEASLRGFKQSGISSLDVSHSKGALGASVDSNATSLADQIEQSLTVPARASASDRDSGALTPSTEKDLEAIRQAMAHGATGDSNTDANGTQMLDDLMRSMARKETQHREVVEQMSSELSALRKQNETLETLSRDQVVNMSLEIEELRAQLAAKSVQTLSRDSDLAKTRSSSGRSLADELHAASVAEQDSTDSAARTEAERLKEEHAAAMESLEQKHKVSLEQLAQQHAESLAQVKTSTSTRSIPGGFGEEVEDDHAQVLAQAPQKHAQELAKAKEEAQVALTKALEAQTAQHQIRVAEHEAKVASLTEELAQTSRAHDQQLQALRDSHSKALQEAKMELEAQHLSALSSAAREAESSTSTKHMAELEKLQQEHAGAASQLKEQLVAIKAEHESTLEKVKAEHASSKLDRSLLDLQVVISDRDETRRAYEELHAKHQDLLAKVDIDPHEVDTLRAELNDTSDALVTLESALTEVQEERDQLLIEIEMMRQESEAQQQDASIVSNGSGVHNAVMPSPADAALKRELSRTSRCCPRHEAR